MPTHHNIGASVVVGHDYRSYSEEVKYHVVKGLLSSGCNIIDIGLSLSPMVYFAQHHLNTDALAMITASHNDNGWTGPNGATITHSARAHSCSNIYFCVGVKPGPPYCSGHPGTDHPLFFPSILCQVVKSSRLNSSLFLFFSAIESLND